ncbi:Oidioi.mRNA.OKI2018_I69.chr1.g232.t1.cds [Oikopleura dioica]|uniref:Oidioi.mRNA.OKI2018_I69.chr1.g232.t1.cds n=1 Tax=Oikopleura dioica TaxID=34765 RepID=A0ABN7SJP9_OIKDI|nr:Oidioi.mRNA.OKI2018_I69.chr1.g232.t1.cds [Oikopleura dioica]
MRDDWNKEIPQFWIDNGLNEETLPRYYLYLSIVVYIFLILSTANYIFTWWTRKNLAPLKRLGEEPLTKIEQYSQNCRLGQEPAMNFISSALITNDRAYIVIRCILAFSSLFLTVSANEGVRSIFLGAYYPLALIMTIYVNFNRELIIEGFGNKAQFLNKLLSWLLTIQVQLRLFICISWWTQWLGICRYRDMARAAELSRALLFTKEFSPPLFLLVEILWFDSMFKFAGVWHIIFAGNLVGAGMLNDGVPEPPQAMLYMPERPAPSVIQATIFVFGMIFIQFFLSTICLLKIWIFKKLPVIGDRMRNRQNCIAIFTKRQALNKFMGAAAMEKRKTTTNGAYKNFGRRSTLRRSTVEQAR